jgi:uncharacterized protein YndB with AHSA1/START domain
MTNGVTPESRIKGTLLAADGKGIVQMEDSYDTSIEDLWSALSEPRRLARWVAEVSGDLRPGGDFRASFTSGWEGAGRLDECEPPRRLLLTLDPGQEDETVIEAELFAEGDQTRLVVEGEVSHWLSSLPTALAGKRTWKTSPRTWKDGSASTGGTGGPRSLPPTGSKLTASLESRFRSQFSNRFFG